MHICANMEEEEDVNSLSGDGCSYNGSRELAEGGVCLCVCINVFVYTYVYI